MIEAGRSLSPRALELLDAPDDVRIEHIRRPVFIPYRVATDLLAEMAALLEHPQTNRMPNLLLVGRSNNGKTELLKEFRRRCHGPIISDTSIGAISLRGQDEHERQKTTQSV